MDLFYKELGFVSWCSKYSIIPKQRWVCNYPINLFPYGSIRLQSPDDRTVKAEWGADKKLDNAGVELPVAASLNDIRRT
jgi:hypothetical protein